MSLLKYIAAGAAALGAMLLIIAQIDRSAYARGYAKAEQACVDAGSLKMYEQLQKVADLNERNIAAVEQAAAEAAAADQALDAQITATVTHLEKLRAQTIPVGADCRRPYDVVRMYQQAAAGPAARDRDGETAPGLPALGDDPLRPSGDAGD